MRTTLVAVVAVLGLVAAVVPSFADGDEHAKLLPLLARAKRSLADGIRQAQAKSPAAAISAKFELDDAGKLSLSVYAAEKGLSVDAEHNVLAELSGSPEGEKWSPEVEVFKDSPHVARSSMQLSLMALSKCSLLEIVEKAAKDAPGATPFSVAPAVHDGKGAIDVLAAKKDAVLELRYDIATGDRVRMEK